MRKSIFVFLLLQPMWLLADEKMLENCRAFYHPDKSVSIIIGLESGKTPKQTDDEFYKQEQAKQPYLKDLQFDDFSVAQIDRLDRSKRNSWKGEKGKGIEIVEVSTGPIIISTGTIKVAPKPIK